MYTVENISKHIIYIFYHKLTSTDSPMPLNTWVFYRMNYFPFSVTHIFWLFDELNSAHQTAKERV